MAPRSLVWERGTAWHIMEKLRRVEILEPVCKALETVERHAGKILQRWYSIYTNATMVSG